MVVLETLILDASTWTLCLGFLGLEPLFWIPGLYFLVWDSWVWVPGFGFPGLDASLPDPPAQGKSYPVVREPPQASYITLLARFGRERF